MNARARTILIGVAAAVLLTIIWFFLLWSPTGKKVEEAKADLTAAQTRKTELETRLARLKRLEQNQAVLESARALFATAIPDADQLDEFILEVNDRATKTGVTFVSVSPQQPNAAAVVPGAATAGAPTVVGLQLQVTGDYFALLRFMEALRDGPRLVTVENLSLSKGGEGNQITASIGGRMFVSNQRAVAAPAPAPAG